MSAAPIIPAAPGTFLLSIYVDCGSVETARDAVIAWRIDDCGCAPVTLFGGDYGDGGISPAIEFPDGHVETIDGTRDDDGRAQWWANVGEWRASESFEGYVAEVQRRIARRRARSAA